MAEIWCEENLKPCLEVLDHSCRHVLGEDFARKGISVFVPLPSRPICANGCPSRWNW